MPPLTLKALLEELASERIRPAYLLAGEEFLLRDDALASLRERVLAGAPEDFNLDQLTGEGTTAPALDDAVRVLPVMATRRLVVLREPEGGRGRAKDLVDRLPDILADVRGQELTVLVVTASKVDKRTRWYKAFADPAAVVACDAPKGARAIADFARAEARRQGVALDGDAAQLLAERVGPQLLLLRQEIAKASLLAGPGVVVARAHIDAGSTAVAEQPIWDLTDAIGQGRVAESMSLVGRLLDTGSPSPMLLGSLASHFRKLARVRSGGQVPGPPFVVRKLQSQARRYTAPRLVACLRAIHRADTELKGASSLHPKLVLEQLVLGLSSD